MNHLRYLIDSVVMIDHLNGYKQPSAFFHHHSSECAISFITRAETLAGCEEEEVAKTTLLLDRFPTLGIDTPISEQAARFRRQYGWKLLDAFQAAVANANSLTLVTRNTKDFQPQKHPFVMVPYKI